LAAQEGVVAVLEKPLDMPLLLDVVKRALAASAEARRAGQELMRENFPDCTRNDT
jgi:FixJ family two-component response regulator